MAAAAHNYFTFILGTSRDPSQTKVTVYKARVRPQSTRISEASKSQRDPFRHLLIRLNRKHIEVQPKPTKTLLIYCNTSHRIDSQPATVVYRNLHYQYQTNTYAALTLEEGAQLCFDFSYEKILLKYIKMGMYSSFLRTNSYDIHVTIEQRLHHKKEWSTITNSADDVDKVRRSMETRLKSNKIHREKRMKSAKNTQKQQEKTDRIDQVAGAIERIVGKDPDGDDGASAGTTDTDTVSLLLGTFMTAARRDPGSWPEAIFNIVTGMRVIRALVTEEEQDEATAYVTAGLRDLSLSTSILVTEEEQDQDEPAADVTAGLRDLSLSPSKLVTEAPEEATADVKEGQRYFSAALGIGPALLRKEIQLRKEIAESLEESPIYALGIDPAHLRKEIQQALDLKPNKLTQSDFEHLRKEKVQLRKEIAESLEESPIYGSHLGSYFDDSDLADLEDIKQVRFRSGDLINSIQVVYQSQKGEVHRGNGGKYETFDLEEDEKITSVSGTISRDVERLSSLTLTTCFGKEQTFGKPLGEQFKFEMTNGSYLGAIKGYEQKEGKVMLLAVGFIPKC